jgi:stress-induced morphogen
MPRPDDLKQRIEAAIPGARAEVQGADGVHFSAVVTAPAFAGKSRIEQHRMVMDVFAGELGGDIHALSIKTQTPSAQDQTPSPQEP